MESLITVVVPVYNVEKYLRKCLDSLVCQTFKSLEIILVEDCSTDKSLEICREYVEEYKNMKLIQHDKNKGLSAARNTGIQNAESKYIAFLDSDDWVEANMYELLYEAIKKENMDVAICGFSDVFEGNNVVRTRFCRKETVLVDEEIIVSYLKYDINGAVWNKLYKKEIFDKNNITFPYGKAYEDVCTIFEVLVNCKKVSIISNSLLFYNRRDNSCTTSKLNNKDLDAFDELNRMKKVMENANLYEKYRLLYDLRCYKLIQSLFIRKLMYSAYDKKVMISINKFMKTNFNGCLNNDNFSLKEKIHIFMLKYFPKCYIKILKVKRNRG